jgi:parallel beta-helix repeat protein
MIKGSIVFLFFSLVYLSFPQFTIASTLSGNYGTLTLSTSGTSGNPNIYVGDGTVVIQCLKITGDYINVSNVTVVGCPSHAVLISGKNDIFENSKVYHSVTENDGVSPNTCSGTGSWGSGIKAMIGSENTIIRGNEVYENCGEGIGITRSINALVENNIVRDNFSVNIYLDNSPFSKAINNNVSCTGIYLRSGNRMTGIVVAEELYSGWGAQRHDNQVLNNNVDSCYDGIASWPADVSGGMFINGTISGNNVTNGQRESIVITSTNQNVLISNNYIFKALRVNNSNGVTLLNNIVGSPPPVSIVADVNGDGVVNIVDIGIIIDNYGNTQFNSRTDLNNDGIINILDIGIAVDNYD